MGKKRDQIKMTEDEVRDFIAAGKSLQLATLDKDGAPRLVTMWYGIRDDGKIVIETFEKAQKVMNIRRDPRIAVLLEDGTTYDQLRGVSIQGTAEIIEDPEQVHGVMRLVLGRNHPEMDESTLDKAVEFGSRKRCAVVINPTRVITWDHRKLSGGY